jgi:ketol-acid reductoisomerase
MSFAPPISGHRCSARTIGIIGYGAQDAHQALNLRDMRDGGVQVLIGSVADASAARARDDGFEVVDIAAATERADVLRC